MSKQGEWYPALIRLGILVGLLSISWVIIGLIAKLCYHLFNLGWGML